MITLHSLSDYKRVLEAVLLATDNPLSSDDLARIFDTPPAMSVLNDLLESLRSDWGERGVRLVRVAGGWRFQTHPDYQIFLNRLKNEKPQQYSRATMETLAVIAYRQPVTRGDIEDIRGVGVSSTILKTLEARGWTYVVGRRNSPGRPALYATTSRFLGDLGLRTLSELPPLADIEKEIHLAEKLNPPGHEQQGQTAPQTDPDKQGEAHEKSARAANSTQATSRSTGDIA